MSVPICRCDCLHVGSRGDQLLETFLALGVPVESGRPFSLLPGPYLSASILDKVEDIEKKILSGEIKVRNMVDLGYPGLFR